MALERETTSLARTLEALRSAHAANDLETWNELRSRVDRSLAESGRTRERAHSNRGDAASDIRDRLDAADRRMGELVMAAGELTEAPSGIATVTRETALVTILTAPIEGGAAAGYANKERALRAEFDRLEPGESRVLAQRLRKARPHDALASQFHRMTADRRDRLLGYLDGARRREAIRGAKAAPAGATTGGQDRAARADGRGVRRGLLEREDPPR